MEERKLCRNSRDILEFTDDIVLLDQDESEAIENFKTIESSAKKVGLNTNYYKTKIMMRNVDKPITDVIEEKLRMKVAENTALEVVNDFKYLGACKANCHVEFK